MATKSNPEAPGPPGLNSTAPWRSPEAGIERGPSRWCRRSGCRSRAALSAWRIPTPGPLRSDRGRSPNRGCCGRRWCVLDEPSDVTGALPIGSARLECTGGVEPHAARTTSAKRASVRRAGRMVATLGHTRDFVTAPSQPISGVVRPAATDLGATCQPPPRVIARRRHPHRRALGECGQRPGRHVNSLSLLTCPGGGIGRHGGLKPPLSERTCGFESHPGHDMTPVMPRR